MNKQKYRRKEWGTIPENAKWLSHSANKFDACCNACQTNIMSRLASIKQHAARQKHKEKISFLCGESKIDSFVENQSNSASATARRTELLVGYAAEQNIPFRAMDNRMISK